MFVKFVKIVFTLFAHRLGHANLYVEENAGNKHKDEIDFRNPNEANMQFASQKVWQQL